MSRNPVVSRPSCLEVYNALLAIPNHLITPARLAEVVGYPDKNGVRRVQDRLYRLQEGRLVACYAGAGRRAASIWYATERIKSPIQAVADFPYAIQGGVYNALPY